MYLPQKPRPPHPSYDPSNPYAGVQRVHPPPPPPAQAGSSTADPNGPSSSTQTNGPTDHTYQHHFPPQPTRLHPPPQQYDPSRPGHIWYQTPFPPHEYDWSTYQQYQHYGSVPYHYHPSQFHFSPYQPRTNVPASMTTTPLSTPATAPPPSLPSSSTMGQPARMPLQPLTESAINSLHVSNGTFDPTVVKREIEEGEEELSPVLLPKLLGEEEVDDEVSDMELDPKDGDAPYHPTKKEAKKAASAVKAARSKAKKGKAKAKPRPRVSRKRTVPPSPLTTTSPATTIGGGVGSGPSHPFFGSANVFHPSIHPSQSPDVRDDIFNELKNATFPLLDPPTNGVLDVNDLLIRHPPTLSPTNSHEAINQYSKGHEPHSGGEGVSKWEMYTCRACRKTYDGKNARSVARRHLQDKHGIPLSRQARRTRWDQDLDRPKDSHEAHERNKKSKRDWAKVTRQQRALEKLHADYLLQFGPDGLQTTWKHPLVAPIFRDSTVPKIDPSVTFKTSDQVIIPPSLRESALLLGQIEAAVEKDESMPFVSFEDLLYLDENLESDHTQRASPVKLSITTSNGSILTNPTPPPQFTFEPYSSTSGPSTRLVADLADHQQHGPDLEALLGQATFCTAEGSIQSELDPTAQFYGFLSVENQLETPADARTGMNETEDGEAEGPPPLWVEPGWQGWREFPSTSSASLKLSLEVEALVGSVPTPPPQHDEAAESLLDLHSSPAKSQKATDETHSARNIASASDAPPAPAARVAASTQPDWMDGIADMIADYSSRPTLKHTKSLSTSVRHPFLNRPGHLARSLSTTTVLDDPFILDQNPSPARHQQEEQHTSASPQSKSRSKSQATARLQRFSPSPPAGGKRRPLESIPSNLTSTFSAIATSTYNSAGTGSKYETPLRPTRSNHHPPSSVNMERWLQFSSPVDPAASLGLVPTHAVPTTPGLSMIIGQDTPAAHGSMGGKRRKGTGGEGIGVGGGPIR